MAYITNDKCPVCGCKQHTTIDAGGSEYASLIAYRGGSVILNVCLGCGTVYLSSTRLERLRKSNGYKKEKENDQT